jgi:hypothetical protein
MFLSVVETIVTQEEVEVTEELYNEQPTRVGLSEPEQQELFDVHGESLYRESD